RIANRGALTDTGLPQPSISPHGPHTIQIPGRAVDGRLALLDADHHDRRPRHVARNLIHYCAQLGWFFALTLIPIGQLVAIEFTMPIWTAILAASFLGERMTVWKITAIVLGVIGVVVIVRPTSEVNPGQLIALAAAVGFG